MAATPLRREEGIGLALAIAAHIGLAAFLLWRPAGKALVTPPERMTVTLSDDVAPTSTSPQPAAAAAPDRAPTIGEPAPQPEPEPAIEPEPLPPPPVPRPVAQPRPQPRPVARPAPRAVQRPAPTPPPKAAPRPRSQPAATAAPRPSQRPATRPAGASSFADAFKEGVPGAQSRGQAQTPPAAAIGPAVQASLASAISRQLKPRWAAPQGAEAEQLVTILSWNLNPDGSLAGTPRVVRQDGITDANRPQAPRHAEQAIRAVQLAAPFDLPEQYYSSWKRIASFRFDRRLSQ